MPLKAQSDPQLIKANKRNLGKTPRTTSTPIFGIIGARITPISLMGLETGYHPGEK
jgi:hypothetical protein